MFREHSCKGFPVSIKKNFPGLNTLAYFAAELVMNKNSFKISIFLTFIFCQ